MCPAVLKGKQSSHSINVTKVLIIFYLIAEYSYSFVAVWPQEQGILKLPESSFSQHLFQNHSIFIYLFPNIYWHPKPDILKVSKCVFVSQVNAWEVIQIFLPEGLGPKYKHYGPHYATNLRLRFSFLEMYLMLIAIDRRWYSSKF